MGYDAASSGGSNLGPTSKKLIDSVKERVEAYRAENNLATHGSGPRRCGNSLGQRFGSAYKCRRTLSYRPARVAKARGMSEEAILAKVQAHTEGRTLGILGEPRVNVLTLNLSLDAR